MPASPPFTKKPNQNKTKSKSKQTNKTKTNKNNQRKYNQKNTQTRKKKRCFLKLHFMPGKRKNFKTNFLGGPDETGLSETAVSCPSDLKSS